MYRASRRVAGYYDDAFKSLGVNIGQFTVIRVVHRLQPVSHTDLANELALDRSTIGRNAKVLLRAGYLYRTEGDDRRESLLQVSDKGTALLAAGVPLSEAVEKRINDALGVRRSMMLDALLSSI